MSCDVAIVGGGISGLYVAETLLRLKKETNVCLFERDHRFGGRIRDHTFQRVSNIPVSKYTTSVIFFFTQLPATGIVKRTSENCSFSPM